MERVGGSGGAPNHDITAAALSPWRYEDMRHATAEDEVPTWVQPAPRPSPHWGPPHRPGKRRSFPKGMAFPSMALEPQTRTRRRGAAQPPDAAQ